MARRAWLSFVALGVVAIALYYVLPDVPRAVVYDGFELAAAVATVIGIYLHRPARKAPWLLLAAAQLCFVAGDLMWDVLSLAFGEKPFPSLADAAYLSAYPLIAVAIVLLVLRRLPSPSWQWFVDVAVITGGIALLLWLVAADPILQSGATGTELAVSLAYPLADAVLLVAVASLLATPRAATGADALLASSLLVLLVADLLFAMFPDLQAAGGPLDAVYLARSALWGAAALHPSMAAAAEHGTADSGFGLRRIVVLALATMVPSVTLAAQLVAGSTTSLAPLAIGCVGISILVLVDASALIIDRERSIRRHGELEAELFEARKIESLGRLAGGIAHDFNNVLTAIIGFADLAIEAAPRADVESLVTIRESAQRAGAMTRQLLAFSRRQVLQPRIVDLRDAINETVPILRNLLGEQIELSVVVPETPVTIRIDRGQFDQVLLNLSLNARDAMPDGGTLTIELAPERSTERTKAGGPAGGRAIVLVSDTGSGIDPKVLPSIFEPFFTTKPVGKGIGLGLAMTHGIVMQSGGSIAVRSRPGAGTTFELAFPVVEPEAAVVEAAQRHDERPKTNATVAVVEDEELIRDLATRILRSDGYDVVVMTDPIDALERLCTGTRFDVLLTDNIMPAMSGLELARRVRSLRQTDVPVVLMSGYSETIADWTGPHDVFLPKPFTGSALLTAVGAALEPAERTA